MTTTTDQDATPPTTQQRVKACYDSIEHQLKLARDERLARIAVLQAKCRENDLRLMGLHREAAVAEIERLRDERLVTLHRSARVLSEEAARWGFPEHLEQTFTESEIEIALTRRLAEQRIQLIDQAYPRPGG